MAGSSGRSRSPMVFVKGGSTSMRHDRMMAAKKADTKRRRDDEARRFMIAKQNPREAKIYQQSLGGARTHASVVLGLRHPKDHEIMDWMVCELSTQEGDDLMLIMCCPRCIFTHNRDPGEVQMHIRQSNRMFYVDQRKQDERKPNPILGFCAGDLWVNPKNKSEVVTIAGMVTCEERSKCPVCGWTFVIDDSVVRTIV